MRALFLQAHPATARLVDVAYTGTDYQAVAEVIGAQWIEHVRTVLPGVALIVDEEGLLTGRPLNRLAGVLYPGRLIGGAVYPGRIVGDALVFSEHETPDEGVDITDLTVEHLAQLCVLLGLNAEELQP